MEAMHNALYRFAQTAGERDRRSRIRYNQSRAERTICAYARAWCLGHGVAPVEVMPLFMQRFIASYCESFTGQRLRAT